MQHIVPNDELSTYIGRVVSSAASVPRYSYCVACGVKLDQAILLESSGFNNRCLHCADTSSPKKATLKSYFSLHLHPGSMDISDSPNSNDNEISPFEKVEADSKSDRGNLTTRTNSTDGNHHDHGALEPADLITSTNSLFSKVGDSESRVRQLEAQVCYLQERNHDLEAKLEAYTSHNESIIHLDFPPGIYTNLEYESTNLAHWKKIYSHPYSHVTTIEEIQAIRKMCKPYSLVCVGAVHKDAENVFVACAVDFGFVALQRTYHPEEASISQNGIGWYCVYDKAFGFAPEEYIMLEPSDTADMMQDTKHKRLSWKLNGGTGHRIGDKFHCSNTYYKVILISE